MAKNFSSLMLEKTEQRDLKLKSIIVSGMNIRITKNPTDEQSKKHLCETKEVFENPYLSEKCCELNNPLHDVNLDIRVFHEIAGSYMLEIKENKKVCGYIYLFINKDDFEYNAEVFESK
jgi:hypothetical protein